MLLGLARYDCVIRAVVSLQEVCVVFPQAKVSECNYALRMFHPFLAVLCVTKKPLHLESVPYARHMCLLLFLVLA